MSNPLSHALSLLGMQRGTLPPKMRLEHEVLTDFVTDGAKDRRIGHEAAEAARDAAADVTEIARRLEGDEFSRVLLFARLEELNRRLALICEKTALVLVLLVLWAGMFADEQRPRAGRGRTRAGARRGREGEYIVSWEGGDDVV